MLLPGGVPGDPEPEEGGPAEGQRADAPGQLDPQWYEQQQLPEIRVQRGRAGPPRPTVLPVLGVGLQLVTHQ